MSRSIAVFAPAGPSPVTGGRLLAVMAILLLVANGIVVLWLARTDKRPSPSASRWTQIVIPIPPAPPPEPPPVIAAASPPPPVPAAPPEPAPEPSRAAPAEVPPPMPMARATTPAPAHIAPVEEVPVPSPPVVKRATPAPAHAAPPSPAIAAADLPSQPTSPVRIPTPAPAPAHTALAPEIAAVPDLPIRPTPPIRAATPGPAHRAATDIFGPPPPPPAQPPLKRLATISPPPRHHPPAPPLTPTPDPALVEAGKYGPLPIIGRDGRQAWRVYAHALGRADRRPRIALLVMGLGRSAAATEELIQHLPDAVTLAFDPEASKLSEEVKLARLTGHEVLLTLPVKPFGFHPVASGPAAPSASENADPILDWLAWVMSRATGYIGLLDSTEGQSDPSLVLDALKARGLMLVERSSADAGVVTRAKSIGLPYAMGDRRIDGELSREAIDKELAELEALARQGGVALGIGSADPLTIERVVSWAATLEDKGLRLAPVSALAERPTNPRESKR